MKRGEWGEKEVRVSGVRGMRERERERSKRAKRVSRGEKYCESDERVGESIE